MQNLIEQSAEIITNSELTLALTGAGVSVESGIPDFRSAEGLWSKYDPAEYAAIDAFRARPEMVWEMLREMDALISDAKPNKAHLGMGELERMGCLHCIVTQNVDNLHQKGGSKNVIEYHGNSSTLTCLWCGRTYKSEEKRNQHPPRCECEKILKPDVVFFWGGHSRRRFEPFLSTRLDGPSLAGSRNLCCRFASQQHPSHRQAKRCRNN